MNEQTISFQTVLDALLASGRDFPRRYLQFFSDIGPLELKTLLDVWPRVKSDRKLALLKGLESLAESDTLVNFDEFARAILNDPDASVRINAIRLLDECEDLKLVPAYIELLKNDPDVNVRAEAANALNLFVDLGELEEIPEETYGEIQSALLESARGEKEAKVRRRAVESLGWSSNPEVVELIETAFDGNIDWKVSALTAMGRSADDRWEDRVLRSMLEDNEKVRKAAVQSAGMLGFKSARLPLLRMLEGEESDEVTMAAIWSLSQIGGEDVQTYLEALLDQAEEDDMIAFLEEALDNLAFTEDLDRFELMSFDPDDLEDLEEVDEDDEEEEEA
ncbi:MAG: HEAT repeat domain-containing protein [Syntrophaceae bacterium]|nr:HEAT repeat domain-containing protein [Syntrophaceae bacterium]